MTPFTSDLHTIDHAINRVHSGAATALYDTLYLGPTRCCSDNGRKVMVVITDGGDTVSKTNYQEAVRAAQEAEVILYSIIIVPIENSAGRDTGGEHALIQLSARHRRKIFLCQRHGAAGCRVPANQRRIRTQYLLAYYPNTRLSDSDYRHIEIKINPATKDYPNPASRLSVRQSHRLLHHAKRNKSRRPRFSALVHRRLAANPPQCSSPA